MDNNDLKERDFEAYIEHWLTTEGGYTKGNQKTYDKERAIDLKTLIRFLQLTQEKKWVLYEKKYGAQTETRLYNVLQDKIHERNLINDDNSRIIICTLHRFPLIYNEIKEHAGKRYALIVDEVHSSQTGKSAEKMKAALADTEEALTLHV